MNPPPSWSAATPRPPVALVREVYEAFSRRDVARALGLFSPSIELVQSTELPWGGVYRGHDGAREFFGKLTQRINSSVTLERLIDAADHVIAVGWTQGTVNATGSPYRVPIAHVWTVRDGMVARAEFHIDHPAMLAALADNGAARSGTGVEREART